MIFLLSVVTFLGMETILKFDEMYILLIKN